MKRMRKVKQFRNGYLFTSSRYPRHCFRIVFGFFGTSSINLLATSWCSVFGVFALRKKRGRPAISRTSTANPSSASTLARSPACPPVWIFSSVCGHFSICSDVVVVGAGEGCQRFYNLVQINECFWYANSDFPPHFRTRTIFIFHLSDATD